MNIQPETVTRDQHGFWTHSQLPYWDEGTTWADARKWFTAQNLALHLDQFEDSASRELQDAFYEQGECNCTQWQPCCHAHGAFLISIHDSEDGPIAMFAAPITTDNVL